MVKLLLGKTPEDAKNEIWTILRSLEAKWLEKSGPIVAALISGQMSREAGMEALEAIMDELEEEARDRLASALDSCWDFSTAPGGPVGLLLEGLDGEAWKLLLDGLGSVAVSLAVWLRDLATAYDFGKEARAARLERRAKELEVKATELEAAHPRRAERLRRRASRKESRAASLRGEG